MQASYRYDPFGRLISKSGSLSDANVYRFSSKEIHVNSGMYYYLYRFYAPDLQRWINGDPVADGGFAPLIFARRDAGSAGSAFAAFLVMEVDGDFNLYAFVE